MSDPVTNIEIEDVLSSIRRLVAEGDRPRTDPKQVPAEPPMAEAAPEKFVLTPAFRVVESDNAAAHPHKEDASHDVAEPDAATEQNAPATDQDDMPPAQEVVAEQTVSQDTTRLRPDAPPPEPEPAPLSAPKGRDWSALEATIAELEAAVTRQKGDWEPDGSEDMPEMDWSQPMSSRLHLMPDQMDTAAEAEVVDEPAAAEVAFTHARTAAAPEPTQSLSADEELDQYHDDLAQDPEDEDNELFDAELSAFLNGDGVIDEATLRAMVADIIREELQGPLGERITRNVRKLVRREIYRVLASHQFE